MWFLYASVNSLILLTGRIITKLLLNVVWWLEETKDITPTEKSKFFVLYKLGIWQG